MLEDKNPSYSSIKLKNILGIDYGEKVTGLATFCPGKDPFPLISGRIVMKEVKDWMDEVCRLIEEEFIEIVVIGLPLYTDGKESRMTTRVKNQAAKLAEKIEPVPVFLQDETLSSVEAKERMAADPKFNFTVDMKKIDAVAASIIIELFVSEVENRE